MEHTSQSWQEELKNVWQDCFGRALEGDETYFPHKYKMIKSFISTEREKAKNEMMSAHQTGYTDGYEAGQENACRMACDECKNRKHDAKN